jgi:leucyl aminopeptidase (aminopeptidase T)
MKMKYLDFVESITPPHMEEFVWNFIEIFTTMRSYARINQVLKSKVKVTNRGQKVHILEDNVDLWLEIKSNGIDIARDTSSY